jgi:site-specific recombinase XerD
MAKAAATVTLARYYAKRDVKAQMRAQGLKPQYIEYREIVSAASAYLDAHPELLEQAAKTVRNLPQLRTLAEREARQQRTGRAAKFPFPVHPHMLRHSTGYKLANEGHDTRSLVHYLGHRNLRSTARYTALTPGRFARFWQD